MKHLKISIEQNDDGYVASVENINGVIVGDGETENEAIKSLCGSLCSHLDTFGGVETNLISA